MQFCSAKMRNVPVIDSGEIFYCGCLSTNVNVNGKKYIFVIVCDFKKWKGSLGNLVLAIPILCAIHSVLFIFFLAGKQRPKIFSRTCLFDLPFPAFFCPERQSSEQVFWFPSFQWKFAQFFCISDNWRTLPFNVCFIFNGTDADGYIDDGCTGAEWVPHTIGWARFGLLNDVQLSLYYSKIMPIWNSLFGKRL